MTICDLTFEISKVLFVFRFMTICDLIFEISKVLFSLAYKTKKIFFCIFIHLPLAGTSPGCDHEGGQQKQLQ